jgi:hypothetical protein
MDSIRCVCLLLALAAPPARAADLLGATYDPATGTHPEHDFFVQWAPCSNNDNAPARTVGRLIDVHGRDHARQSFRIRNRLSLSELPCRPALVTLRLGRVAHMQVFVPEEPGQ